MNLKALEDRVVFDNVIQSMGLRNSSQKVYRSMSSAFLQRLPKPLKECSTVELEGAALAVGSFASAQKLIRLIILVHARVPTAFEYSSPERLGHHLERKAPKRVSAPRDPVPLLQAASAHARLKPWQKVLLEAVVELLKSTGLKKSELVGLRWGDISEGMLVSGKGLSFRQIPLPESALSALEAWKHASPCPTSSFVFVRNPEGDPVIVSSLLRWLRRFSRDLEVVERPVSTSSIRAALALKLASQGRPLAEIQKVLGHKRETSTQDFLKQLQSRG